MITTDALKEKLAQLKAGEQEMLQFLTKQRGAIGFCEHLITEGEAAEKVEQSDPL